MSNTSTTPTTDDDTAQTAPFATLSRLAYVLATHAPLHERYMPSVECRHCGEVLVKDGDWTAQALEKIDTEEQ